MQAEVTKKRFTVDEYYRMADAGILREGERVELIDGEIIQMSPIGHRHMVCVNRANMLLANALNGKAIVSVQNPLRLNQYNEPQPDIVIFEWRDDYYAEQPYTLEATLFVIEVSDTTLRYDRNVKLPLYAANGVREVWIANLAENALLVCRDPAGKTYESLTTLRGDDLVACSAFPHLEFTVKALLG
jgi:Uma2 family endonuclease